MSEMPKKADKVQAIDVTDREKLMVEMLNTATQAVLDAQKTMEEFMQRNSLRIKKMILLQKHLNRVEGNEEASLN